MSVAGGPINTASNLLDKALGLNERGKETTKGTNPGNDPELLADESGEKMRALAWYGKNDVRMVDALKPKVVDPTDVVLKVTGSTVCGSDLHLMHGAVIELQKGDILGHEFMGIVESVGDQVKKVKPGDRVVASFNIGCGQCSNVMQTMFGNRTCGMFGYSHFTGGFAGGQSEYTRVPWGDANLLKIPDEVADEDALYLSDVLVTSYHCVVDSGVKEGDVVGIWGAGPIGVFAAKFSLLKGASRVIMIDNVAWRLSYAKSKLPEVETLDFNEHKNVAARINELTKGKDEDPNARPEGLDVALECAAGEYAKGWGHTIEMAVGLETDTSEILNEMILSVRNFGTVGITGVYAGFTNHFNIGAVMEKGVRLIGNGQAPVHKYWEELLNDYLIPKKISPIDLIVTQRISLEDVAECYKQFDARKEGIVKVFVETKFSGQPSDKAPRLTHLSI
ncbi:hypothetical protein MNV49_004863 [Pseudohyphozyma bogoriensis]|nr:hypothetical protein MNV49_004863 [Pseudohyphozyma bogoriensis]